MYIYIFIHVMDCFCTNILYNFGSLSGTKLLEKIWNNNIKRSAMSCKLAFQSSCSQWSFRKAGSWWLKRKEKKKKRTTTPTKRKKAKEKVNISILSAKTVSTGGCRHCCHGYKITNTYEGLHSSHRHLKKHGLFFRST